MPATATKKAKKAKDEEEEKPAKTVKKGTAEVTTRKTSTKSSKTKTAEAKNGKVATTKKTKKSAVTMSARDCVLRVLVAGAPRTEVKARARKVAEEEGAEVSFKTFDVSYFINYLTTKKGYTLEEKKKAGTIKLIPPKAEATTKKKAKASK